MLNKNFLSQISVLEEKSDQLFPSPWKKEEVDQLSPSPWKGEGWGGGVNKTLAVAPMMDWTDRHYRYFARLLSPHALLYTEMVTTGALLHGDRHRFLQYNQAEHPVALQLGGCVPREVAQCSKMGEDYGYSEINLNIGCPSSRVQSGGFGAYLMAYPELVATCVSAMQQAVTIPVTVKTRIGIDHQDSYEALCYFVKTVAEAGCKTFIIHARKAWLEGLSPKENREIPPLRYDVVKQLKQDFPRLDIFVNGGIKTLEAVKEHLDYSDGVMIGREAYQHPYFLAECEQQFLNAAYELPDRAEVIERFLPYVAHQLEQGVRLQSITRHILGLFHGMPGAKYWRRHLSENAHHSGAGVEVIKQALNFV